MYNCSRLHKAVNIVFSHRVDRVDLPSDSPCPVGCPSDQKSIRAMKKLSEINQCNEALVMSRGTLNRYGRCK